MSVIHFLVGRPKSESSNGVVKSVYYLTKYELNYTNVSIWCISSTKNRGEYILDTGVNCKIFPKNLYKFKKLVHRETGRIKNYPIVFHIHGIFSYYNILLMRELTKNNIKYVLTPHGSLRKRVLKKKGKKFILIPYLKRYIKNASKIRVLSRAEAKDLTFLNIRDDKIVRLPNGIEVMKGNTIDVATSLSRIYEDKILIFIGRLDVYYKGLDILIKSLRNVDFKSLYIVGPFVRKKDQRFIISLIHKFGLDNKIFLLGELYGKRKEEVLKKSYFFLHPSRSEGFPLGVLEALSFGIPVVISTEIDPDKIMETANAGFVVEPEIFSVEKILKKINDLDFNTWIEMKRSALKFAYENFEWRNIAGQLVKIYDKLV